MVKQFTKYQRETLEATFLYFDSDEDGFLYMCEFKRAVHNMGISPSESEFDEMLQYAEVDSGRLTKKQFIKCMEKCEREPDSEEDIANAFQILGDSKNTGISNKADIKQKLMNTGENFSDDEFLHFSCLIDANNEGNFDHRRYGAEILKDFMKHSIFQD